MYRLLWMNKFLFQYKKSDDLNPKVDSRIENFMTHDSIQLQIKKKSKFLGDIGRTPRGG